MAYLTLTDRALLALIAKQQRKSESVEALFLRMLTQRNRREEVARAQQRKSLSRKLEWHRAALRREQEAVARLQREIEAMTDPELGAPLA